jgi:hypothetical protein
MHAKTKGRESLAYTTNKGGQRYSHFIVSVSADHDFRKDVISFSSSLSMFLLFHSNDQPSFGSQLLSRLHNQRRMTKAGHAFKEPSLSFFISLQQQQRVNDEGSWN